MTTKLSTPKSAQHRCAYCHERDYGFNRCSRCKVLHYCSTQCQTKHWKFVHKNQCKRWKRIHNNRTLTEQEIDTLDRDVILKYSKLSDTHDGPLLSAFTDMMNERARQSQKNAKGEQLFDDNDNEHSLVMNSAYNLIVDAFDRDGDRRLNYQEWISMIRELSFRKCTYMKEIFYEIAGLKLLPEYLPSLSNGSYGTYSYPDARVQDITFGPCEIVETFRYCAYLMSTSKKITDPDFQEEYDFGSELAYKKAFTLMFKFQPHAQAICCSGETPAHDFFDAVLDVLSDFGDDIVSVIYSYVTWTGECSMQISWHRLRWSSVPEAQEGMWDAYQKHMYYDICYILKQDDRGLRDIMIHFEICDNVDKCNKKLEQLNADGPGTFWKFRMVDAQDRGEEREKWGLGMLPAYVPDSSFSYKEHAILIGKILKFHGLNPKLCHYIYVGTRFKMVREKKHQIVVEFNKLHQSTTKYRPHEPKKPMLFDFDNPFRH